MHPTATEYSVRVVRSESSSLSQGEMLIIGQAGGLRDGVAYMVESDPILLVGETYVFFLMESSVRSGYYTGQPFGRFNVNPAGRLVPVHEEWLYLPAVAALDARTVPESADIIAAALASANSN